MITPGPTERVAPQRKDKGFITVTARVIELLPGAKFRLELDGGQLVMGHLSGKMRLHRMKILPGDKVSLEISPYDLTKGRIVYRL